MKRFTDRFLTSKNFDRLARLEAFTTAHGRWLLDIAFGRLASRTFIPSVIAGASTPEQIDLNLEAVAGGLTAVETVEAEAIFEPQPPA